jgi:hypothetical protein
MTDVIVSQTDHGLIVCVTLYGVLFDELETTDIKHRRHHAEPIDDDTV